MLRIGVTGLMGSGKSTVARRFKDHGAHLIEGDVLGWETLEAPPIRSALLTRFGSSIAGADGAVDRAALGRIVFRDTVAMADLNAAVQPELVRRVRAALELPRGDGVVVLDAALLSLWRLEPELDLVVEIVAPEEIRTRRLVTSKGFSESEARQRILGQKLPKIEGARRLWRLENKGTLEELHAQADEVWRKIKLLRAGDGTD